MAKKVTYQEISRTTSVSVATISRVVKGSGPVSEEKRKIVLKALKKAGADLSLIPPPAESRKEPIILVQLPSLDNQFYTEIVRGIDTIASAQGCHVLLHEEETLDDDNATSLLRMAKAIGVSGLICMNTVSDEVNSRLKEALPMVYCSEKREDPDVPYVSIDDIGVAYKATEFLILHGNRDIVLVNGPMSCRYARDRAQGFSQAMKRYGMEARSKNVITVSGIDYDLTRSAVSQLFCQPDTPDAVFAASDVLAAAVISVARKAGMRVPEDVEVIGFDNTDISRMCIPSITTVSQPRYQMGLTSCELLLKIIRGEGDIQPVLMETELVLRSSTR